MNPISDPFPAPLTGPATERTSAERPSESGLFLSDSYARRLRAAGCIRIRLTDRKHLRGERDKIQSAARAIGRPAHTSYRYPYLYAWLGERGRQAEGGKNSPEARRHPSPRASANRG